MQEREAAQVEKISEVFEKILKGDKPSAITLPKDFPDNEIRRAAETVNRFIHTYTTTRDVADTLSQIIDFLPDPTFVIDNDGRVISWNRAMETLTNVPAREMLGKSDYEYALPFYGERRPILIDLVREWDESFRRGYLEIKEMEGGVLQSEAYLPGLNNGAYISAAASRLYDAMGNPVGGH